MVEIGIKDSSDRKVEKLLDLNEISNEVEVGDGDSKDDVVVLETTDQEPIKEQVEEYKEERLIPSHRRKKKINPAARIGQYAHKAKTFENAANMLFEQNKYYKEQLEKSEREKQSHIEHSLQLKLDAARQAYERSAEEGDVETQAKAQQYMTQFNTELTLLKNKEDKNYSHYHEPENLNEFLNHVPVSKTNPYLEEWLQENEWMDPSSPYYDQQMYQEALMISNDLDRQLKRTREVDLIGTPAYLEAIADSVKEKFHVQDEYEEEEETYEEVSPSVQRQNVAPVSRSSGGYMSAAPKAGPRTVVLTPKEKEMALRMDYGVNLSAQEKIKRWADSKYNLMKNGQL